jgi:hypothetical protein
MSRILNVVKLLSTKKIAYNSISKISANKKILFFGVSTSSVVIGLTATNYTFKSLNFNDILSLFLQRVECEAVKQNRTVHFDKTVNNNKNENTENFDWNEFFKLIYKEKWYFLGAIAVSDFKLIQQNSITFKL